jgi:hypothetical protein
MNSTITVRRLSESVAAYHRYRPGAVLLDPAAARSRSVRRRVSAAWGLLLFNTMTYVPGFAILDLPSKIGKGLAQGALPLALLLLLTVNPKLKIRPNVFLCVVSVLIADTLLTAFTLHQVGTGYRTTRLAGYLAALWLLTPWWGRRDMLLMRIHLRWLYIAIGSVFLGMLISPGRAFAYGGRLTGAIWPMVPTQVAHYAAMAAGLTIVLWLTRLLTGRATLIGLAFSVAALLLSHTRTALVGLVAGILIAGLSLFIGNARVRRFFAVGAAVVSVAVATAAGFISTWLARGQDSGGLTSLTGRTNFWGLVLNLPRTKFQEFLGFGLSNVSIDGLPIDSNWLAAYMQEGLFGVVVGILMIAVLLVTAFLRPPGVRRALALFIVTYCVLASFTEDAFSDASPYLLDLVVAASLLALALGNDRRGTMTGQEDQHARFLVAKR